MLIIVICIYLEEVEDDVKIQEVPDEDKQVTGRVVSIIHRKWQKYCGILQLSPIKGVNKLSIFS